MKKLFKGAVKVVIVWSIFHVLCGPISDLMGIQILKDDWVALSDSFLCALASVLMVAIWTHDEVPATPPETVRVFRASNFLDITYQSACRVVHGLLLSFRSRWASKFQKPDPDEELRLFISSLGESVRQTNAGLIENFNPKISRDRATSLNFAPVR